jgi:hypothetical protein
MLMYKNFLKNGWVSMLHETNCSNHGSWGGMLKTIVEF